MQNMIVKNQKIRLRRLILSFASFNSPGMAACGVSKGNLISLRNFAWIYFQRDLANEVIKNL